ncbi:Serine/threonine-protein phosphatase 2A activator 1, partial [Tulasnella sp. 403]
MAAQDSTLPVLRQWTLPPQPTPPEQRIKTDEDVQAWTTTQGYIDYGLFIRRLAEARSTALLQSLLPSELHAAIPLVEPYFVISFGSFQRLDYGSGHEVAFGLFLCALTLLRFYQPTPEEERTLVLVVFVKYLEVVWKLQDVYRLEPAGSHGVWGLDDYCFLPYIWGNHLTSRPPDVLNTSLPETNLYFLAINRIHKCKTGPFYEHSSQLYNIATGVQTWWKVNQGLFTMYEREVLGKRVVVQHLLLGGIIEWGLDDTTETKHEEEEEDEPAMEISQIPVSPHAVADLKLPIFAESKRSPITTTTVLPAVRNLAQRSPTRQGTMPRPKGGRLATALVSSPENPPRSSHESAPDDSLRILGGQTILQHSPSQDPVDLVAEEALTTGEPDLHKELQEPLPNPTSPQNVAKILTANPVDYRRIVSKSVEDTSTEAVLGEVKRVLEGEKPAITVGDVAKGQEGTNVESAPVVESALVEPKADVKPTTETPVTTDVKPAVAQSETKTDTKTEDVRPAPADVQTPVPNPATNGPTPTPKPDPNAIKPAQPSASEGASAPSSGRGVTNAKASKKGSFLKRFK